MREFTFIHSPSELGGHVFLLVFRKLGGKGDLMPMTMPMQPNQMLRIVTLNKTMFFLGLNMAGDNRDNVSTTP